jgi:ubiquinone/menaquinone biosynthesis C-methylase UbiE
MSAAATSTLQAYGRWAADYPPVAHNPLMRAEQRGMQEVWPNMQGGHVLDLACGSGRYSHLSQQAGAAQVVALDFCMPMLAQVAAADRVQGSMMQLPFRSAVFDAVICGLAVAHATDIRQWMAEVARVLRPNGNLLYSDFHSAAIRAGMTRSFKDGAGVTWTVPHQVYDLSCQQEALAAAGLKLETVRELRMGMELSESFAGSQQAYRQWFGVPVVLIVRACKRRN